MLKVGDFFKQATKLVFHAALMAGFLTAYQSLVVLRLLDLR
jgi:hypothetical protein